MMSKKISIINGPNLNLLGKREPGIYGTQDFDSFYQSLQKKFPEVSFTYFQSNVEGELINELQRVGFDSDGIVFNPGGYTHTSVAIGDAVAAISVKVIEVHISNVFARESFRQHSYVSPHAKGVISGLGLNGYNLAIKHFLQED